LQTKYSGKSFCVYLTSFWKGKRLKLKVLN